MPRPCIIGLDEPEYSAIADRLGTRILAHETLPRIMVRDGRLYVESTTGAGYVPISSVVFHGIFENDHDLIAGLALWGGPCLPNARAMMDCRLKLPCLVRALKLTRFAEPPRGYASPGVEYATDVDRVAKWGNWHCGENKARFQQPTVLEESSVVERFLSGEAVRVVIIGDRQWQIKLEGEEACFGQALVQRAKSEGENPAYYVLGQTDAGRYLFCVVIQFPDGKGYPVTARPMTDNEKRRYRQWRDR